MNMGMNLRVPLNAVFFVVLFEGLLLLKKGSATCSYFC